MKALVFVFLAAKAAAAADEYKRGLPPSIQHFVERKIDCDHWTGEYRSDAQRPAEIDRAIRKLRCDTLSRDKAALHRHYRHNPSALKQLNDWAGDLPKNAN